MKIKGVNADKTGQLLHMLARWDEYITYYRDESDELYTILIGSEVPILFHYNYPFVIFELGCDTVRLHIDDFVDITIIQCFT